MELYIIRHAQSTNNALTDTTGRVADPSLTELGHHQAELLAQHLAANADTADRLRASYVYGQRNGHHGPGFGIGRLYCSPMWRSLQTAQPVARALGLQPHIWLPIHEVGGVFLEEEGRIVGYGGKTRAEIIADYPGYVVPDEITENGWWNGGREEDAERDQRALRVATELHRWAATDERIALISHGGFINRLFKALFNLPTGRMLFYQSYNTGISRIEFGRDGRLVAEYLNRVDHLPPEMLS